MPMARTSAKSVSVLMEKSRRYTPANVPTSAMGTARQGMSVARQSCRKRYTTANTSSMASSSVRTTSSTERRTKMVVS